MPQIGTRAVAWPANHYLELTRGVSTTFNATDLDEIGSGATAWAWDFGDGNTASVASPSHTYTSPGLYTLSLDITYGTPVRSYRRVVRVGVDLGEVRSATWVAFEAVWVQRLKRGDGDSLLYLMPLLAATAPYTTAAPGGPTTPVASTDVAELGQRIAGVYRDTALNLPLPEPEVLPDGIYLLAQDDVVYAGSCQAIQEAVTELELARAMDDRTSLEGSRPWNIAAALKGILETVVDWNGTPAMPTDLVDLAAGAEWLAPGLSSMALSEANALAEQANADFNSSPMFQAQDLMDPLPFRARRAAMLWLGLAVGAWCRELRYFGEQRGGVDDPARYFLPKPVLIWNPREASLAWAALGDNENDAPVQELGYIAAGVVTLDCGDLDRRRLTVQRLSDVALCPGRRVWNDEATRSLLGEDRELGDHVVDGKQGRTLVRMETGQLWRQGQPDPRGVEVVAKTWALISTAAPPVATPLNYTMSVAERWTAAGPAASATRLGTIDAPSTAVRSAITPDSTGVTRAILRPGGELRTATRGSSAITAVVADHGAIAVTTAAHDTDTRSPWRNPLRRLLGKEKPGHDCGCKG